MSKASARSSAAAPTARRVTDIDVRDAGVLRGVTTRRLRKDVRGRCFGEPWRHGKWLIGPTDEGPALVWHFGMTGALLCASADEPVHAHDRLVFTLDDERELRYRDQRKLQGVHVADSDDAVAHILGNLGPDALTVDRETFLDVLANRRGSVKSVLMDQSALAGLGNLLCDEILWRARAAPTRPARTLGTAEAGKVYAAMRRVLKSSVEAECVPSRRTWLTGRRDDHEPRCPRCHGPLLSRRLSSRRTVWCPHCQS